MNVPPMFAPDLPLYLNVGNASAPGYGSESLNPYYLVPVPHNGTGYLKFNLAPASFAQFSTWFHGRLWAAMFVWNLCWWAGLAVCAFCLFERFLAPCSPGLVAFGVALLMLFNFGVLKTLMTAWVHLPSMSGFETLGLPFMRAFVPVIPTVLLVAYLALQMEALRRRNNVLIWVAMGVLQFAALAGFPYATLMMAGITAVSLVGYGSFGGKPTSWLLVPAYAGLCGIIDGAFALRGSLGFYSDHVSMFEFQPRLLFHLVGGNWLLLGLLVTAVAFNKNIPAEVKWPLIGLGVTNLTLLLGDVVVPAKIILLSHHAGHFIHANIAILVTFLAASVMDSVRSKSSGLKVVLTLATTLVIANGILLSVGTYRGSFSSNLEEAEFSRAMSGMAGGDANELIITRSKYADDPCGWVFLLTHKQVLYCTDAEVMLTPKQNLEIQRFRQAIYLYLSGVDGASLQQALAGPFRLNLMYQLGYWAEASSLSPTEQEDGIREIKRDLIPWMERVERQGDPAVRNFFQQFPRVVVVDSLKDPFFSQQRLAPLLSQTEEHVVGHLEIRVYSSK